MPACQRHYCACCFLHADQRYTYTRVGNVEAGRRCDAVYQPSLGSSSTSPRARPTTESGVEEKLAFGWPPELRGSRGRSRKWHQTRGVIQHWPNSTLSLAVPKRYLLEVASRTVETSNSVPSLVASCRRGLSPGLSADPPVHANLQRLFQGARPGSVDHLPTPRCRDYCVLLIVDERKEEEKGVWMAWEY